MLEQLTYMLRTYKDGWLSNMSSKLPMMLICIFFEHACSECNMSKNRMSTTAPFPDDQAQNTLYVYAHYVYTLGIPSI